MSARAAFLELVDGWLAGALDGERLAELDRALRERPEARRLFWLAVHQEVLLRQYSFEHLAAPRAPRRAPAWRRAPLALAAAALLALAVTIGWGLVHGSAPRTGAADGVLASVAATSSATGAAGAVRHRDQRAEPLRPGLALRSGDRLEVAVGASVDLRLQGEATAIGLGSHAALTLADGPTGMRLGLEQGALVAEVAHQAPGRRLAIATPQATVEVIGTRLAVAVAGPRTSVEVEQGRVRVAPADASAAAAAEAGAGETAIVEAGRPVAVAAAPALSWPDRRPLGVLMLSAPARGWRTNPRGWFDDPLVDVTTAAGLAAFDARLDATVDGIIARLRGMDAQGVVFWDLEGFEFLGGYVGDPRQLGGLAPEMDAAADRVFARLRAAGFAVGTAVSPQAIARDPHGAGLVTSEVSDPARLLQAKVDYAQRRWGATIFPVVDHHGTAMSMATVCRRVLAASPGTLLIPTAADAEAFRWSAPWQNPANRDVPLASEVRRAIPGAFSVLAASLERDHLVGRHAELVQAAAAGDILTFRAWYDDPLLPLVKDIQAEARQHPRP